MRDSRYTLHVGRDEDLHVDASESLDDACVVEVAAEVRGGCDEKGRELGETFVPDARRGRGGAERVADAIAPPLASEPYRTGVLSRLLEIDRVATFTRLRELSEQRAP